MSSYGYSSPSQPSSVPSAPSTPSPPAQQVTYTPPAPVTVPTPTPTTTPARTPTPVRVQTAPVTQPVVTGPFAIDGYYPLYTTIESAVAASPDPTKIRDGETTVGYHTHTLRGIVYYMSNGLEMNVTQFHGNYGSVITRRVEPDEPEMSGGNRVFSLKDSSGNFSKYSKGEVVLHRGELYEVLFDTFAKFPTDQKFFRLLTEETDVSIIDGGEF